MTLSSEGGGMLIEPAIAVLSSTPSVMRAMLGPLSDELIAAPGADGWSARDVVAHLFQRQRPAIYGRVSAILEQPGGPIPDVPQNLMDPQPLRSKPFADLLAEFEEGRRACIELLRAVTPEQLTLRGVHSSIGELSIADVIHHTAFHDLVHIAQAAELAGAPLEPLRGAMRQFR
jgi:hypothetical protein